MLPQREAQRNRQQQRRRDRFGEIRQPRRKLRPSQPAIPAIPASSRVRRESGSPSSNAVNSSSGISEKLNTTVTGLSPATSNITYRARALNPYSPSSSPQTSTKTAATTARRTAWRSPRLDGKLRIELPNPGQQRGIERRIFGLIRLARKALDPVSVTHRQAAGRYPVDAVVMIEAQVRHGPQRPGQVGGRSQRGQEYTENG